MQAKLTPQLKARIQAEVKARSIRYDYTNYTKMAVAIGAQLMRENVLTISDTGVFDFIDDTCRDAVEWPDNSTLGDPLD